MVTAAAAGVWRAAAAVGTAAADLLFPRHCVGCRRGGALLCDACLASAERGADTVGVGLQLVLAPFVMDGAPRKAVHRLKYGGVRGLAAPMGAAMAQHLQRHGVAPDCVVPLPLHPARQRERGYNQSELLAREVARWLDAPLARDLVARTRRTSPQVETATRAERLANVDGAFEALRPAWGQSVVIVDDVTTTGATLQACAAALRQAGARRCWGLAFASAWGTPSAADPPA